jgi:hypothetical protein
MAEGSEDPQYIAANSNSELGNEDNQRGRRREFLIAAHVCTPERTAEPPKAVL